MAVELIVAAPFPGYVRGQIITDANTVAAILSGPYADSVRQVILTTGGSSGSNAITGVPSTIQVGVAIQGTYQASSGGHYVCVRIAGVDQLPRVALPGTSGALPTISSLVAGIGTLAMYDVATGGSPLFETGQITFTTGPSTGIVLPPNALLLGTDASGNPVVISIGAGLDLSAGVLSVIGGGSGGVTPTLPLVFSDGVTGLFTDGSTILLSA